MNRFVIRFVFPVIFCGVILGGGAPAALAQDGQPSPPPAAQPPKVSLDLKGTALRQALGLLFESARVPYRIDPDIQERPITLVAKDIEFQTALQNLLQAGSGPGQRLTYRRENGVYSVLLSKPAATASRTPDKVLLTYVSAQDVLPVIKPLLPEGVDMPIPTGTDNSLLVQGDPEGLRALRDVIRLIDVAPMPVVLEAEISGPGGGPNGKPLALTSLVRTIAGKEAMAEEKAVGGAGGQGSRLQIRVKPVALGDGSFLVENSWDLSLPLSGGPKGTTVRLEKRLSTTTKIKPGESVAVGDINADQWGGKGKITLFLTAVSPPKE